MTDAQLLEQFVATGSQPAFAALVERHVTWVAAAARRRVRDPHLAEDVTQAVFILLAQKARSLRRETVLSAWLFQATRYSSMAALRAERRRARREERAAQLMRQQRSGDEAAAAADVAQRWEEELAPELDELVAKLGSVDRRAVLLRFYEQKSFGEVGRALGLTEEAARKRVARAVEKLRNLFRRRGVTVSAVVLAGAMAAHVAPATAAAATTTATAGLAAAATAAALANAAAAAPFAASATAQSAAGLLAWAKIKAAAAVLLLATTIAAVGGGTTVALLAQSSSSSPAAPATSPATAPPATAPASTQPVHVYAGRVVTPDGAPAAGADVLVLGWDAAGEGTRVIARGRTAADGAYRIAAPADKSVTELLIDAPPWAHTRAGLGEDPAEAVVLWPPSRLDVTVLGPDGKPAAGVNVAPSVAVSGRSTLLGGWHVRYPPQVRGQLARQTDAAGRATFERLPRRAQVRFEAVDDERFAVADDADQFETADAEVAAPERLALAAAASIAGRVTFADGRPAAGVRVGAQSTDHSKSSGWGSAVTDAQGRYRIGRLRGDGTYNVAVDLGAADTPAAAAALRDKWTAVAREKLAVGAGQHVGDVDLRLIEGVELRGRVFAKDAREPVTDMSVGLHGPSRPRSGAWVESRQVDANGEYRFRVPPGENYVYLQSSPPEGYVASGRNGHTVQVAAGNKPVTVDFELVRAPGKPVTGRVVGPDGNGVAGAHVTLERADTDRFLQAPSVQADAQGNFAFRAVTRRSQLRATAKKMRTLRPVPVNGGEQDVVLRVARPVKMQLTGTVVDTDGKPVPRAEVAITVHHGSFGIGGDAGAADAQGRYVIADLEADRKYTIRATAPGHGEAQAPAKVAADEKQLAAAATENKPLSFEQAPIVLKRAGSFVSGVVVDEAGKPMADVQVAVNGRSTAARTTRTDAAGRFEFADIVDGETVRLNAFHDGEHGEDVEVPAGTVDVTVRWKPPVEE